ncbi:MAG: hypothetical protein AAGA85_22155, partial [Bacteroidota bacterium]
QSPWARTSKVVAAILGSLIATLGVLTIAALINKEAVVLSIWITFPSVWVAFIAIVYWIKSPWKVWGLFLSIALVSGACIYFLK